MQKKIKEHDLKMMGNFKKSNINYVKLYTNDDVNKLRGLFG